MRTVLILDDDDTVRESMMDFFEDRGWRVLSAASAKAALEAIARETPDGMVVDIRLPGMDGNEFIRQASRTCSCPAYIIVTGSPEYRLPEDVRRLPQVSANVFTKPVLEMVALEHALLRQIDQCRA